MMDDLGFLIDELYESGDYSMPVRAMQKLLARGDGAVDPLIEVLRDEDADNASAWAAVLLGELRAAHAAPELADAVRRSPANARWLHVPFAEALASIGIAVIPAIKQLAASDRMSDRIWAYYAAGLLRQERVAYDFLIASLESDAGMMDVVGNALAEFGDRAAIGPLYDALRRAAVWQRPDIEDAIRSLHHERWRSNDWPNRDWRTRYRLNDFLSGHCPTSWAVVSSIVREEGMLEDRAELPLRQLEEILADPDDWPVDRCECCQLPTWRTPGVPVCAQTAAAVPAMQAGLLGKRRDASGINDIFDMLDDIEDEMLDVAESQTPSGGRTGPLGGPHAGIAVHADRTDVGGGTGRGHGRCGACDAARGGRAGGGRTWRSDGRVAARGRSASAGRGEERDVSVRERAEVQEVLWWGAAGESQLMPQSSRYRGDRG